MYTKPKIYNLALGALLLQRQISDPDNDQSNECKVLNTHWDTAFRSTLEDLDLDSLSSQETLELLETDPADYPEWKYIYKYPTNCAFFRRIKTTSHIDDRSTHIPKKVGVFEGVKAIFTNEYAAIAEIIPHDLNLSLLSANAGLCVAYKLALLSAPLIVGKGAKPLREDIQEKYIIAKAEAQEQDRRENFNYLDPEVESEFVRSRLE